MAEGYVISVARLQKGRLLHGRYTSDGKTRQQHEQNLSAVFQRLEQYGLRVNLQNVDISKTHWNFWATTSHQRELDQPRREWKEFRMWQYRKTSQN